MRRRKSKNWLVLATEYNVNYVNLTSWTCAVQAKGLRNESPNGQFVPFDDCFDLAARVVRTVGRHEHGGTRHAHKLYIQNLGAFLAQANCFFARSLSARAALHAWPGAPVARKAPAIATASLGLVHA
jgi:hypothetical protein